MIVLIVIGLVLLLNGAIAATTLVLYAAEVNRKRCRESTRAEPLKIRRRASVGACPDPGCEREAIRYRQLWP